MTDDERDAEAIIEKGTNALADDPTHGVYWISSGQLQLATIHAENAEIRFSHLLAFVDVLTLGYEEYSVPLTLEVQNNAIIFAAAANRLDKARSVANIPVGIKHSHKFDVLLNHWLRQAVGASSLNGPIGYVPTRREAPLFEALEQLATAPVPSTVEGLHKYWKATRNRRYAYTIHQKLDLFSLAARNIQQATA